MPFFATQLSLQDASGGRGKFSLRLKRGGSAYIIAPTGCGKTHLARSLCGLDYAPDAKLGATRPVVEWEGRPLAELDSRTRAMAFAYLPSIPQLLFSLVGRSLRQELQLAFAMLGRQADELEIEKVVSLLELNPILNRDPREFSGGEQMRSAVACVLVRGPSVIIADQITDQVDPEFRQRLAEILEHWCSEEGGILVNFSASFREEFPKDAQECVFFTGKEVVAGTAPQCWQHLKHDAVNFFDGVPRLGAVLQRESLAVVDVMPREPVELALTVCPRLTNGTDIVPSESDSANTVEVSVVNFGYPDGPFQLRNVTIHVRKSTITAVLGHNGAGKTTLLKCIGNLVGPWEGTVSFGSQSYNSSLPLPETARKAMYCFQNPDDQIYRQTVAEELAECAKNLNGGRYTLTPADLDLARQLGLAPFFELSPFDLPLSMRRLLVIGSCLVARPPMLLLDEPTAWLDAFQKDSLKVVLAEYLHAGGCGVMVSHDVDFVSGVASSLVFLSHGTVQYFVDGPVMLGKAPASYQPSCLKVAEYLTSCPKLWREPQFIECLNHV